MKITKQYLRKIIKEEVRNTLIEIEKQQKFKLVLDDDPDTPYPKHAVYKGKEIWLQFSETRPTRSTPGSANDRAGSVSVTVGGGGLPGTHSSTRAGDAWDPQRYVNAANQAVSEFIDGKREKRAPG